MSILKNKKSVLENSYLTISILGKSYKLDVSYMSCEKIKVIKKVDKIYIILPLEYMGKENIDIINITIKNLYNEIAKIEIENSMEFVRHMLGFAPEDYLIKRMNDTFCKTNKNIIIVNPDIVQYSREVINQTIIQSFCKVKYRTNSNEYKDLLKYAMNKYENQIQKLYKVS